MPFFSIMYISSGLCFSVFSRTYLRRKWQHTPVLLPWKSHGQRSLVGYSPWGRTRLSDWACTQRLSQETVIERFRVLSEAQTLQVVEMGLEIRLPGFQVWSADHQVSLPLCGTHLWGQTLPYGKWDPLLTDTVVMPTLKGPCLAWQYRYICYLLGWKNKNVSEKSQENLNKAEDCSSPRLSSLESFPCLVRKWHTVIHPTEPEKYISISKI